MTNQQHPITPPPELVQQWASESLATQHLCTQAARWGADQELEACCEWFRSRGYHPKVYRDLLAARRKPPSLKEQALAVIENSAICDHLTPEHEAIIRRALEALPDV